MRVVARGSLSASRIAVAVTLAIGVFLGMASTVQAVAFPWNGPIALLGSTTNSSRSADDVIADSTDPSGNTIYVAQTGNTSNQAIMKFTLTRSGGDITGATSDYVSISTLDHNNQGLKSLDIYDGDTIYYTLEEGEEFAGGSDDGTIGRLTGLAGSPTHTVVAGLRSVRSDGASDFDPEGIAINAAANALYVFTDDGADTGIAKFTIDPGTKNLLQADGVTSAATLSPTPVWATAVEAGTTNGNDGIVLSDGRIAVVAGTSSVNIYAVTDNGATVGSIVNLLGGAIGDGGATRDTPQDLLEHAGFLYVAWESGIIDAFDLAAPSTTPSASMNLDVAIGSLSIGGIALTNDGHLLVATRAAGGSTGEIYALNTGAGGGGPAIPTGTGGSGSPVGGVFQFAGVSFNQKHTPDELQLLGGASGAPFVDGSNAFPKNVTFSVGFVATPGAPDPPFEGQANFDPSKSVGQLAFEQFSHFQQADSDTSAHYAAAINLPGGNDGTLDRHGIQLGWSDGQDHLVNQLGKSDFVVYESGEEGSPEAFMVRVRKKSDGSLSDWLYKAASSFELYVDQTAGGAGAFAHLFDLSDFGFATGDVADLIEIANLMPGDTIDDLLFGGTGLMGFVRFDNSGNTPLPGALSTSGTFGSSNFDPDILYVGVLGVPEPTTVITLGLGMAGMLLRRRRVC